GDAGDREQRAVRAVHRARGRLRKRGARDPVARPRESVAAHRGARRDRLARDLLLAGVPADDGDRQAVKRQVPCGRHPRTSPSTPLSERPSIPSARAPSPGSRSVAAPATVSSADATGAATPAICASARKGFTAYGKSSW